MLHKRVLFVCKNRTTDYGMMASSGLWNSALMVAEALEARDVKAHVVSVIDANAIDKEVVSFKPTHVVIEALWVTPAKLEQLAWLHRGVQWIVRIHSKAPFISGEGIAFEWITQIRQLTKSSLFNNVHLAANSTEFNNELNSIFSMHSLYLPNIYTAEQDYAPKPNDPHINIGCFGSARLLKNQLIQAIAAIELANDLNRELHFHVNGTRQEQKGEEVMKNIRSLFAAIPEHKLVEHPWLEHDEFLAVVQKMDLGMQVSFTETFNIVAADFVSQGVPIVVSPDITWMPEIMQVDPNSSRAIVDKMKSILGANRRHIQHRNWDALEHYNKSALKAWIMYLE